jgi:hypothetical protein
VKKLEVFLKVLEGFDNIAATLRKMDAIRDEFADDEGGIPTRLTELTTPVAKGGLLPPFDVALSDIKSKFDVRLAREKKKIVAFAGLDPEYDDACRELQTVEDECAAYLTQIRKQLGDSSIKVRCPHMCFCLHLFV